MSADFQLEVYLPHLSRGCCPNKIYAVIFNHSHEALLSSLGVYSFATFQSSQVDQFKIALTEHAERPWYFFNTLSAASVAQIPDTLPHEPYWIEYWQQAGITPDRNVDTLEKGEALHWQSGLRASQQLTAADLASLQTIESHVAVGYDSTNHLLRFIAFLSKNGRLVTDPQSCEVKWLTRDGLTIAHFTIGSTMPQMPGVFQAQQAVADVTPDEVTPVQVTIRGSDNIDYNSAQAITTWD